MLLYKNNCLYYSPIINEPDFAVILVLLPISYEEYTTELSLCCEINIFYGLEAFSFSIH